MKPFESHVPKESIATWQYSSSFFSFSVLKKRPLFCRFYNNRQSPHYSCVTARGRTPCPRQRRSCRALRERRHRRRLKSPRLRQRHCRLLRRNTTRQPVAMRCRAFIIERVPRRFFHHHRQSSRSRPRSAPSSSRVCPPRPPPRETIPPP